MQISCWRHIAVCLALVSSFALTGESAVELKWVGKENVVNHHLDVPYHILEKKWDFGSETNSGNLIIHGDNLLALKSLLPKYEGKVKCIYIDPPYNTGNEGWCYNDNVNDPRIKKWLGEVVGKEGEDFTRHDKWLCMMYPRLKLLQKLLVKDGVIFISIDDNEQANLRIICDEIFGAQNFIAELVVQRSTNGMGDKKGFARNHDYCICYQKSDEMLFLGKTPDDAYMSKFDHEDEHGRYKIDGILMKKGAGSRREDSPTLFFPLYYSPVSGEVSLLPKDGFVERLPIKSNGTEGRWTWGKKKIEAEGYRLYGSPNGTIYIKDYLTSDRRMKMKTVLQDGAYLTDRASNEIKAIFERKVFDTPKPIGLLVDLLDVSMGKDDIILDSFAGSGTTAHAVLNLNKKDGGNRKFILVELGDYAEKVTAERVRRVIEGYGEGEKVVAGTGGSFSYYELGEPLMQDELLNPKAGVDAIREYVWYSETKTAMAESWRRGGDSTGESAYLGTNNGTAYYFFYEPDNVTELNRTTVRKVKAEADDYVVYADVCTLSVAELERRHITFKKIPRDIATK